MPHHIVSASAEIPATADKVYSLIADYHLGHPRILPRPHFESLVVEKGGVGAGTVIRVGMRVMGLRGEFRAAVSEPLPGRLLEETDLATGRVTAFVVDPLVGSASSRVTITTRGMVPRGPIGWIQGWILERTLRPIFEKELAKLSEVATDDGHARAA